MILGALNLLEKPSQHRSIPYSFRIGEEALSVIVGEAIRTGTPPSGLISQIVTNYARRDMYFHKLGFLPTSKDLLRLCFDKMDEESLIQVARQLGSMAREYVLYFFHHVNRATLLEFLTLWFSTFNSYEHKIYGETHLFVVDHDINEKYSVFMKEYLKAFIEPIISKKIEFELTPNVISFSFEL
jgi:hypothetical protein